MLFRSGVTAVSAANLPLLIGLGLREFCVAPVHLREFLSSVGAIDARRARKATESAAASACMTEAASFIEGFRHGYLRS